jgi:hypothetical protein
LAEFRLQGTPSVAFPGERRDPIFRTPGTLRRAFPTDRVRGDLPKNESVAPPFHFPPIVIFADLRGSVTMLAPP